MRATPTRGPARLNLPVRRSCRGLRRTVAGPCASHRPPVIGRAKRGRDRRAAVERLDEHPIALDRSSSSSAGRGGSRGRRQNDRRATARGRCYIATIV